MEQKRPVTPEKQLLGLIENSRSRDATVSAKALGHRGLSFFSPGAWLGRFSFARDQFRKRAAGSGGRGFRLDVATVNRILTVGLLVLCAYFAASLVFSITGLKKFPKALLGVQEDARLSGFPELAPLKVADYLEKIRQRDIFKIKEGVVTEQRSAPKVEVDIAKAATAHLKLVGISWSSNPDAMIEDTKAMRTFFVKQGQMIGDVRVQKITKDKVTLSFGGREVELK